MVGFTRSREHLGRDGNNGAVTGTSSSTFASLASTCVSRGYAGIQDVRVMCRKADTSIIGCKPVQSGAVLGSATEIAKTADQLCAEAAANGEMDAECTLSEDVKALCGGYDCGFGNQAYDGECVVADCIQHISSQYEEREFTANFVIDEGPEPIYSVATPRHSMNNDAFEHDVVAFGVPGEVRLALQDTLIRSIARWGFPELQSMVVLDDNVVDGATIALGTSGLHLVHLGRADGNSGSVLLLAGDQDAIRVTTVGVRFTYNRDDDSYSTAIGEVLHVSAPAGITGDDEFGSNIVVAEEYLVVAARSSSRCTEGNGELFVYRCTMNNFHSGDVRAASDCVNEWNASGPVSRHCGPASLVNVADNLDILFERSNVHRATPWKVVSGGFWVDVSVAQDDQLAKVVPELPTDTKDVRSVMVPGGSAQVFRDHSMMRFPFVAFWYDATLTVYYGDDVGVGPVWHLTHADWTVECTPSLQASHTFWIDCPGGLYRAGIKAVPFLNDASLVPASTRTGSLVRRGFTDGQRFFGNYRTVAFEILENVTSGTYSLVHWSNYFTPAMSNEGGGEGDGGSDGAGQLYSQCLDEDSGGRVCYDGVCSLEQRICLPRDACTAPSSCFCNSRGCPCSTTVRCGDAFDCQEGECVVSSSLECSTDNPCTESSMVCYFAEGACIPATASDMACSAQWSDGDAATCSCAETGCVCGSGIVCGTDGLICAVVTDDESRCYSQEIIDEMGLELDETGMADAAGGQASSSLDPVILGGIGGGAVCLLLAVVIAVAALRRRSATASTRSSSGGTELVHSRRHGVKSAKGNRAAIVDALGEAEADALLLDASSVTALTPISDWLYGAVCDARCKHRHVTVLTFAKAGRGTDVQIARLVASLRAVSHPSLPESVGLVSAPLLIVTRGATGVPLRETLASGNKATAGEWARGRPGRRILAGVAAALAQLHDADIVHGNVSTDMVVVADDGSPVLMGAGVIPGLWSPRPRWSAPELLGDLGGAEEPTAASDVYSLAVLVHTVLLVDSRGLPWADETSDTAVLTKVLGDRTTVATAYPLPDPPVLIANVLRRCLQWKVTVRPCTAGVASALARSNWDSDERLKDLLAPAASSTATLESIPVRLSRSASSRRRGRERRRSTKEAGKADGEAPYVAAVVALNAFDQALDLVLDDTVGVKEVAKTMGVTLAGAALDVLAVAADASLAIGIAVRIVRTGLEAHIKALNNDVRAAAMVRRLQNVVPLMTSSRDYLRDRCRDAGRAEDRSSFQAALEPINRLASRLNEACTAVQDALDAVLSWQAMGQSSARIFRSFVRALASSSHADHLGEASTRLGHALTNLALVTSIDVATTVTEWREEDERVAAQWYRDRAADDASLKALLASKASQLADLARANGQADLVSLFESLTPQQDTEATVDAALRDGELALDTTEAELELELGKRLAQVTVPSLSHDDFTFDKEDQLGSGSSGAVYAGTFNKMPVAVKMVMYNRKEEVKTAVAREAATMASFSDCPYVVHLYGQRLGKERAYLVMEQLPLTLQQYASLTDPASARTLPTFDKVVVDLLQDVTEAMALLHARRVLHHDLKGENVLVSAGSGRTRPMAKLADFGLARGMGTTTVIGAVAGTPAFLPPEYHSTGRYTPACDVFSYGMTVWEALHGASPFAEISEPLKVGKALVAGERPPVDAAVRARHPKLLALAERCWATSVADRPTFASLASSYLFLTLEGDE
jgi:serine/threonine protein kinase